MSALLAMILAHIWITVISGIALFAAIFLAWIKYTLYGKDFWVAFPVVGKMSGWRQDPIGLGEHRPEVRPGATYVDRTLVVPAEKELYDYYVEVLGLEPIGANSFLNAREYLKISNQNGRKPMSMTLWGILGVLTVAEAVGTGLLLAPLLSNDITPAFAMATGTIIALVIAIIAVGITHGAGEDLFCNTLLSKVRNSYRHNGGFRKADGSKFGDFVQTVGPEDDQPKDADLEPAARLAARIGATDMSSMSPKRMKLIFAIAFIVLFGAFTTGYRHYLFNKQNDAASSDTSIPADAGASANFQSMFSDSGNTALPDAVSGAVKKSEQIAQKAIKADTSIANDWGILILALIYVFTQLMGLLTGYKYSFFHKDGEKAYEKTRGELGYDDFLRHVIHPVAQRVQMRLSQLRAHLSHAYPAYRDNMQPFDFMTAYFELAERKTVTKDGAAVTVSSVSPAAAPAIVPAPTPAPHIEAPASTQAVAAVSQEPDIDAIAANLLAIEDLGQRRSAMLDAIRKYGMKKEQQTALMTSIQRIRSERGPEIDPDLLNALEG